MFTPPLGLTWPLSKTVKFNTTVKTPTSGRGQTRWTDQQFPIWELGLNFGYLKGSESIAASGLQQLMGFYLAMKGAYDTFLYEDPNDNFVTNQVFGMGDGSTTAFQLTRNIGLGVDIVQNPDPLRPPVIHLNFGNHNDPEVAGVNYTLQPNGIIQWTGPPAPGMTMTWSGGFFYRFHFQDDTLQLDNIMHELWDDGGTTIKLESVIL